jgi:formate dehydrogenase subunit gamma
VVPVASVSAAKGASDASAILKKRTEMQRWRVASAANETPAAAVPEGDKLRFTQGVQQPKQLVQSWLKDRPDDKILKPARDVSGISSLPYKEAANFEQPGGRDWRRAHNDQIRYGGGWLIFGVLLALALFLTFRGRIPLAEGYSGERIERFSATERANHWMTATSFIFMGITGLIVLYGKPLLLPLIGADAMGSLARWSAWLHMAFAVPFVLGILLMIVMWLIPNLPDRYDWPWIKRFGGFLNNSGDNPPAGRFNTGQKLVFWGVVLGGLALLASGVFLMFPFYFAGYDGMQWAQIGHAAIALLLIALIFGHIYIGTVGMEDAFEAMWSGKVDRNWLKEHHSAWLQKVSGRQTAERD